MRMLPITLWLLTVWNLVHGHDVEQDYQEGAGDTEVQLGGEGQSGLGAVSSMEDLLEFFYPRYGLVQSCLRKRAQGPSSHPRRSEVIWGNPHEAALYRDDGAIQVIMAEIERTMCRPREVCLDVSKEFPESTSHFYLPRCISVHRCGGCCSHEALHCTNTSHSLVNKTLVELSPSYMEHIVIMVTVINHTSCECRPKRPLHSIIRRAADSHHTLCSPPDVPCSPGLEWDPMGCQCVPEDEGSHADTELDVLDSALLALCGPNKVLDKERCECACPNGLTEASCGPGRHLDEASCRCVCGGSPGSCPPNQRWHPERCSCVCLDDCPHGLHLEPETCQCQCRESPRTCLLQGKRFNPQNCSCYRLPCRTPYKKCNSGFYYSHYVCNCIPNHMRTGELN
ncbi:hypothetical protein MATL_G00173650 [Megalops atlanticus]|uniref:Platelet-derived growth factor (PDGF) family profile domain-containing protein n=1 Tax=Megalops atlanticus TaxID=7932 RepID=A0A9D3PPS1_MEGAT|nr:hypothetical protein MATL_G00173650 [Megalops atlanticus]